MMQRHSIVISNGEAREIKIDDRTIQLICAALPE